jgi:hypothetical protein
LFSRKASSTVVWSLFTSAFLPCPMLSVGFNFVLSESCFSCGHFFLSSIFSPKCKIFTCSHFKMCWKLLHLQSCPFCFVPSLYLLVINFVFKAIIIFSF